MPTDQDIVERFYRWNAPIYDCTRWVLLRGRAAAVNALGLKPGDRVLEIGCGTGLNLPALRRAVGPSGRVVGVDFSGPMLARARRRRGTKADLVRADAARLPMLGPFDAVLAAYSLTIMPPWRGAVSEAGRCLRDGGRFVVLDFSPPPFRPSFGRRGFDRYLARNHVDPTRDLHGLLARAVGPVEELPVRWGYLALIRATRTGDRSPHGSASNSP